MCHPILVISRFRPDEEVRARFRDAALACVEVGRRENGCLGYDLFESSTEPGAFVLMESWEQRIQAEAHRRAPAVGALLALAGTCALAPPVVEVIKPRSVDRL
jgi:quinol monooxygenase YgiN